MKFSRDHPHACREHDIRARHLAGRALFSNGRRSIGCTGTSPAHSLDIPEPGRCQRWNCHDRHGASWGGHVSLWL